MNVDAVKFYREQNSSAKEIKSEKTEHFQNLFDALSGGKMAEEIRGNYNVTLDVASIGNCYDLINNYDIRCTNYVRISPQTLQDMEKNPALKNKVLNAIKEFCSKESQIINSSQATNILDCVMLCLFVPILLSFCRDLYFQLSSQIYIHYLYHRILYMLFHLCRNF